MSSPSSQPVLYRFIQLLCGSPDRERLAEAQVLWEASGDLSRQSIHAAAMVGDADTLRKHIDIDPGLVHDVIEPAGATPLILACLSRWAHAGNHAPLRIAECVRILIDHGADPNATTAWSPADEESRFSPLEAAAGVSDNASVVQVLLEAGADPGSGRALFMAVGQGYTDCARALVEGGADLQATIPPYDETPLHVAAGGNHVAMIEALCEWHADVDARTAGGKTAYAIARRHGFEESARLLALHGADVTLDARDRLAVMLQQDQLEEARRLVEERPELVLIAGPEDARLLPDMAAAGELEAVRMLIEAGADLESRGADGGTALHQAARHGRTDVVRYLVEYGSPLNLSGDLHDSTPLGWAVRAAAGPDVTAAQQQVYRTVVEVLLNAGAGLAHPQHPDRDPAGGWLLAMAPPEIASVLAEYGAAAPKQAGP